MIVVDLALALGRESGVEVRLAMREFYPTARLVLTTGGLMPEGSEPLFPLAAVLRKPFTSGDIGRVLKTLARSP